MSLLARLSLANRGLVALVSVVTVLFGAFTIPSLKQQLLPSLEFPAAFVSAVFPGAAPEIVEAQVTEPIENAISTVSDVESVSSTSSEGFASIQVEFAFGTDLGDAVNNLETALNRVGGQLPDGVDPVVFAGSTDDLPAVVLAATADDGELQELSGRLADSIVPQLESIDGVRAVDVTGASEQLITINPDYAALTAAGLDPAAIASALRANGVTIPAGALVEGDQTLTVQVGTRIETIEDLGAIFLTAAGRPPVRLDTVAEISEQTAPATSITRTNGAQSLGIAVTAGPDGDAVGISHEIRDQLAELGDAAGTELVVVFDQAPFVERSIEALTTEGLLGLVMAVLVILVFLWSIRSTVVTAVSIPLSVLVALIALWIGDHSLNLLTLGALTISVGRVVDDSIVVLENIKRHLEYGEDRRTAILIGVREVAGAVTSSTLATVAVFAPIAIVGGFVGQLFAPFAITVTVALLASLLVSLTVIPVLAYWFLKPAPAGVDLAEVRREAEAKELRSPLQRGYLPVIRFATTRRWTTVGIGLAVLLGTFALSTRLETNFIDDAGQDTLSMTQELPVGSSLASVDAAAGQVERQLARTDGIESYQVSIGSSSNPFAGGGGNTTASYSITLTEGTDNVALQQQLRDEFADRESLGEITVGASGGGPGGASTNQLQVIVQTNDPDDLATATERVRAAMAQTPDVADVTTTLAADATRIEVQVDREAAAGVGLTEAAVGQLVAQAFRGSPLGQLTLDGERLNVVLSPTATPTSVEELQALPVGPVALGQLAEIVEVSGPVQISRVDGERSAIVTGTATGSNVGQTSADLTERLDALSLPAGATFTVGGVSADQAEAFADLGLALLAAIAIVFVIMVATFRSLIQPLILLVSVPFAATGAIGLLVVTGTPLGVPALIGALMLVGIVVTNAIVLMDLVNQYREQGMSVSQAVVEGGRRRLRPILMTAIATICALTPMALGLTGVAGFIGQPLAIVVIGGLLSSTVLTLVLVPTLYTMVEGAKDRLRQRRAARSAEPASDNGSGSGPAGEPTQSDAGPADRSDAGAAGARDGRSAGTGSGERSSPVAAPPARPSAALIDGTDQFEVLKLPKSRKSPLPPADPPAADPPATT
ncbi:efflux RND transporter permease subunit [Micromonospora sp. NBC_01813]|uniref:efflux RND transporter permease subunit n=1 Tax=Micromonospora sp. NBC_01813 TaxID=2975988 RepID=UPI002DDB454D|nr:efflux RND transporter permease subunit [Micromonospora sp. NBC_01813]WSA12890.1 efflux RND transporter permease subunit [Micromonospora sp. NBC_01813]